MRNACKSATVAVICAMVLCAQLQLLASDQSASLGTENKKAAAHRATHPRKQTLSKNERSSVISVALHSQKARHSGHDCSHLVHAVYEDAGFPYLYADSEDLFSGVQGFERIARPQPADLIVWHGHVGIVVHPGHHSFFSFLSRGPKVDDYTSRYWRGRGEPRFYRYVKNDPCPGCVLARGSGE